jgi:hypothetical protein
MNPVESSMRLCAMEFGSVYPLYIKKAERKGRTKDEVDAIIFWMTGYDVRTLREQIERKSSFKTFFAEAPDCNPNIYKVEGSICGIRVEAIEDDTVRKVRCLDKLIDELAKGKALEKILRK